MDSKRPVIIKQLPRRFDRKNAIAFLAEVTPFLQADRVRVVFDFSDVKEIDSAGIAILLQCMEEVMKGNGDLKFAALQPGPSAILELTGVVHLFEVFESVAEAAESFEFIVPALQPVELRGLALEQGQSSASQ
jgi:anti-anti-sigma factor